MPDHQATPPVRPIERRLDPRWRPRLAIVVVALLGVGLIGYPVIQATSAPRIILETRSIGPCPSGVTPHEALCFPP